MLLSFSNDTPVGSGNAVEAPGSRAIYERGNEENHKKDELDDDEECNDMTLSPSSFLNVDSDQHTDLFGANFHSSSPSSPPPESVYSDQLTTLTPPPIYQTSSKDNVMDAPPHTCSGSVSLFSGGNPPCDQPQRNGPSLTGGAGGGGNFYFGNTPTRKKRPPLPPRWAISGSGANNVGVASSHHAGMNSGSNPLPPQNTSADMVDVVPSHLFPPPKQIGPLSHRRVLSTGDASFLSNLTDPDDSYVDNRDNSPPMLTSANANVGVAMHPAALPHAAGAVGGAGAGAVIHPFPIINQSQSSSRKPGHSRDISTRPRGVSWDFGTSNHDHSDEDELGILQPILQADKNDKHPGSISGCVCIGVVRNKTNLMQPKLDDQVSNNNITLNGTSSAFPSPRTSPPLEISSASAKPTPLSPPAPSTIPDEKLELELEALSEYKSHLSISSRNAEKITETSINAVKDKSSQSSLPNCFSELIQDESMTNGKDNDQNVCSISSFSRLRRTLHNQPISYSPSISLNIIKKIISSGFVDDNDIIQFARGFLSREEVLSRLLIHDFGWKALDAHRARVGMAALARSELQLGDEGGSDSRISLDLSIR